MISVNIFKHKNLISALSLLIFDNKTGKRYVKIGSLRLRRAFWFELIFSQDKSNGFKNSSAPVNE